MESMRTMACAWALVAVFCGCSGEDVVKDADEEAVCLPSRLRCDPEGTQMLQQCDLDGMGWSDFIQCDMCHDSMCYGLLDGSSG
jgi:hypothetical protein